MNAYLVFAVLLARIELGSLVDVIAACVAADAHGKHHAHLDLLIFGLLPAWDLGRVEVWGVILVQNLPFSHLCLRGLTQSAERRNNTQIPAAVAEVEEGLAAETHTRLMPQPLLLRNKMRERANRIATNPEAGVT
jgi:hypothetical protein